MAPSRPSRPRLIVGTLAVTATALAALLAIADAGPLALVVQLLAGAAVFAALVGTVFGLPAWGTVTALLLGAAFVTTLHDRATLVDARTPVMAAALLLVAELVTWAAEERAAGTVVPGAAVPRPVLLLGCTIVAYVAGLLLTGVVGLPVGRDLALTALGAAAVVLVTATVVTLARGRAAG